MSIARFAGRTGALRAGRDRLRALSRDREVTGFEITRRVWQGRAQPETSPCHRVQQLEISNDNRKAPEASYSRPVRAVLSGNFSERPQRDRRDDGGYRFTNTATVSYTGGTSYRRPLNSNRSVRSGPQDRPQRQ